MNRITGIPKLTLLMTKKVEKKREFYQWLDNEGLIGGRKELAREDVAIDPSF